jgi:hypothetical protein
MRLLRYLLMLITTLAAVPGVAQRPPLIKDVRAALNAGDAKKASALVEAYRKEKGADPYWLEAHSWLARGELAAKRYEPALELAEQTRTHALEMLKTRKVDEETSLPLALGASIEVRGQALNATGQKSEAVAFLQEELKRWDDTSMRTRIQKNLHLITLEGKPAPALDTKESIGSPVAGLGSLKGKPVLLFFWAHWCGDCKAQAPILARISSELRPRGLRVLGPTQTYGYVAGGEEAPRAAEVKYIGTVRDQHYSGISGMAVPLGEENFRVWGASTTPTLALIDRKGIVRLYHPGRLTYEELKARIEPLL